MLWYFLNSVLHVTWLSVKWTPSFAICLGNKRCFLCRISIHLCRFCACPFVKKMGVIDKLFTRNITGIWHSLTKQSRIDVYKEYHQFPHALFAIIYDRRVVLRRMSQGKWQNYQGNQCVCSCITDIKYLCLLYSVVRDTYLKTNHQSMAIVLPSAKSALNGFANWSKKW